jgi:hypothetical protein
MKLQLVILAIFFLLAVTSKKDYCGNRRGSDRGNQSVQIDNCANSKSCGTSVNGFLLGNSNAIGIANSLNGNFLGQYRNQIHF